MNRFRALLGDRRRRQRGSILSSVLIIVAFLSILVGALMTELTSSFLISRTLVTRTQNEATDTSAIELGIHQLQSRSVPSNCAKDAGSLLPLSLNGTTAAVTQTCQAIVPDVSTGLAAGNSSIDGVHDTSTGRDQYLITSSTGLLSAYPFGQTTPSWSVSIGGPPSAPLLAKLDSDGAAELLIPARIAGSGCVGHCVALFNAGRGAPRFICGMPSSTEVTSTPASESSASGALNFPDYAFFDSSGAAANLYVYDAEADGSCDKRASAALGGAAAGSPLIFPGTVSGTSTRTTNDEIFVLVTSSTTTDLQHWRYTEQVDADGVATFSLSQVRDTLALTGQLGGNAIGYAASSPAPTATTPLKLVVAGATGTLATVQITMGRGPSYALTSRFTGGLPGAIARPPYWCHCPGGQDVIGVGTTAGSLYLLSAQLVIQHSYDGAPPINTTPMADSNGDWYFGANDGSVYDVEIPVSGQEMFKAATFGPGGVIGSSPIVEACPEGPCLYFASSTAGAYFAQLGGTRITDLHACVSSTSDPNACTANPRLWARVEVGSPAVLGVSGGVLIKGWSFYSP
jgi:hypothetical protein